MSNTPGPWIWSTENNRYYRHTVDAEGNPMSEWAPQTSSTQSEVQQAQPTQVATPVYTNYGAASELQRRRTDSVQTQPEMAPAAPADVRNQIRFQGTPHLGWYDRLDSSYRVREKREAHEFFKTGRVFAMLWAESASATMSRGGTENTAVTVARFNPAVTPGRFQEEVYSQIRRFVVVKVNRQRHFIYACAVSTYGKQGTLKRGCNAAEHCAVYLNGSTPQLLRGEWERGMTKDPIMIIPTDTQEFMDPTSRLRCGRIYSIEWNVKLKDIGMVSDHDRSKLLQYFNEEQETGFDNDEPEPSPYQQYTHAATQNYYQQNGYYGYAQ